MGRKKVIQQNDHIILPKATLKRFADEMHRIYYLDLNDLSAISVKHTYPTSYHSKLNYYNPEYDDKVKQRETAIGKLHKEILTAIEGQSTLNITAEILRKQIVDFITIEFHRSVIANDTMLEKYKSKQQMENDRIDSLLFQTGKMTMVRNTYSVNYRQQAKSKESFRSYAQNILGTSNQAILTCYNQFYPQILHIPPEQDYRFLLPPIHFVGNDQFACFILSPTIALALYPKPIGNSLMLAADKERTEIINLRILESVSSLDFGFREVVGEKSQLEKLKRRVEKITSISINCGNEIVINGQEEFFLAKMDDVFELVIILSLVGGTTNRERKVQMKMQNFDASFWAKNQNEIIEIFRRYSFQLIF